mmetsp:Transcript_42987/g.96896  ORF Transcript_42987/g.96896 Transcript_42987/m.96896 type:complete len:112 (+) Transcript_42987:1749-2084(+)
MRLSLKVVEASSSDASLAVEEASCGFRLPLDWHLDEFLECPLDMGRDDLDEPADRKQLLLVGLASSVTVTASSTVMVGAIGVLGGGLLPATAGRLLAGPPPLSLSGSHWAA